MRTSTLRRLGVRSRPVTYDFRRSATRGSGQGRGDQAELEQAHETSPRDSEKGSDGPGDRAGRPQGDVAEVGSGRIAPGFGVDEVRAASGPSRTATTFSAAIRDILDRTSRTSRCPRWGRSRAFVAIGQALGHRDRLALVDVQARPGDPAATSRADERRPRRPPGPSARVDEVRRRLHQGEGPGVDQVGGLGRSGGRAG